MPTKKRKAEKIPTGGVEEVLPSPAWERLKAKPREVAQAEAGPGTPVSYYTYVRPGGCRCHEPHVGGHRPDCYLFLVRCQDCGMASGTHKWNCPFWDSHPGLTPFDGHGNFKTGTLGG